MNNLVPAPRIDYRLDHLDATISSKLSASFRPNGQQKATKTKKQTRSITPRETYTDVMKEIAVTKAVINKMLQQDPRPNMNLNSEKKGVDIKNSKNSIRQVNSNQQLVTTKNKSLGLEEFPGDIEPIITTN